MPADIKIRPSARVVLLDDNERLLMLRIHAPAAARGLNPITADFWHLVGGGVEPGETYQDAARREVLEETGISDVRIGRCVWTQEKLVSEPDGTPLHVIARFYVGRVAAGVPVSFAGHEPLEAATILGYRWFTRPEIISRELAETFLPPGLGGLLGGILREDASGEPAEPISLS